MSKELFVKYIACPIIVTLLAAFLIWLVNAIYISNSLKNELDTLRNEHQLLEERHQLLQDKHDL